ncbi:MULTISPECIES: ribonuclease P protein component [unclassified Coleofasciculus]|uniref:ribonuclease P protein component n=1 Tax=unclassified Coleofasciculus TaxID=2692782 RepID=UPI001881FB5A|nr:MULTISPECIES: ribonuclease P protein component [unclassified Coleofasciculus]MBE9128492.1 ribonuclease P protein component [Coleofasciculus sp. LEGE 07081]MBE9148688.1 ribonuclease P protein component [Coleofasciculus sp. LEGE 07092]
MLPQLNRLKHWRDFQAVYQKGIRRSGRHLTLRGLRQPVSTGHGSNRSKWNEEEQPPTRIGISISQKVSKKAVVRNRIKRQIRAALRQLLPGLSPGWRLVVVVRPTALECDYAQILRELEQLMVEIEVVNGH